MDRRKKIGREIKKVKESISSAMSSQKTFLRWNRRKETKQCQQQIMPTATERRAPSARHPHLCKAECWTATVRAAHTGSHRIPTCCSSLQTLCYSEEACLPAGVPALPWKAFWIPPTKQIGCCTDEHSFQVHQHPINSIVNSRAITSGTWKKNKQSDIQPHIY